MAYATCPITLAESVAREEPAAAAHMFGGAGMSIPFAFGQRSSAVLGTERRTSMRCVAATSATKVRRHDLLHLVSVTLALTIEIARRFVSVPRMKN